MTTPEHRSTPAEPNARSVLWDSHRTEIMRKLDLIGPATTADLATVLRLPLSTTRHHLKILRDSGLITTHNGNNRPYEYVLNTDAVRTLLNHDTETLINRNKNYPNTS